MDTKQYIESGIIESYALGMLNEKQALEVEEMARHHDDIGLALREAQHSLEQLAERSRVEPPQELRDKILSAALAGEAAPHTRPVQRQLADTDAPAKSTPVQWLAIAASLLLLASLGINTLQYQSIQKLEDDLGNTLIRLATLESENEVMVANFKNLQEDLSVMRDPATAIFPMRAVEGRTEGLRADVLWNAGSEVVYLDVKNLPAIPADKQFQLWALKDGQPIDMGVFDPLLPGDGLKEMGRVPGADAFAVTLEPRGGSASPTLEEMYVYGTPAAI